MKLVCYDQLHTNFDNLTKWIIFVKKSMMSELNDHDRFEFEESDEFHEFFED